MLYISQLVNRIYSTRIVLVAVKRSIASIVRTFVLLTCCTCFNLVMIHETTGNKQLFFIYTG